METEDVEMQGSCKCCSEGSEVGTEVGTAVGAVVRAELETELGTAVGDVVKALEWEQRMWRGRDSSCCCAEVSEFANRGCGEVRTAVSAVRALK